jgi:hypothetical protein
VSRTAVQQLYSGGAAVIRQQIAMTMMAISILSFLLKKNILSILDKLGKYFDQFLHGRE